MKLLRYIIFLNLTVLLTSVGNHAAAFFGAVGQHVLQQTDTTKRSGPVKANGQTSAKDTTASEKLEYFAKDSTKYSADRKIVYLYGGARLVYQGMELDADFITYDENTKLLFARGTTNAKGKYVGRPIIKMEGQGTSLADSIRYNTDKQTAQIWQVFTEQEGGFFSGGKAKKQPDDEIHSKGQTYSTCNLPHPHFGIHITKGIISGNQIITGPVYLKIEDIPLPLGLPFAFFPKPNKKSSGIIMPSPGEDFTRGFFLRDGGYYLGLNDYWDAKLTGTIYTRGSYDAMLNSNYTKRYKYNGNIVLNYSNMVLGTEGTRDYSKTKDFKIQWNHSQNANAKPGTSFSASVDAGTSSYNRNTAASTSYDPYAIARNTLRSSISYGRVFDNGMNLGVVADGSQETQNKTVSLRLPDIVFSVPTFSPFDSKDRVGEQKWYQKITVGYNMQASNSISTVESQLFKKESLNKFSNGVNHQIPVSWSFAFSNFLFNTGVSYQERWAFQTIERTYLRVVNSTDTYVSDTIPGFKRNAEYSANFGVSTKVYSLAQFNGLGNFKALRHVMTPRASFSYRPDFSDPARGYYKLAKYSDGTDVIGTDGLQTKYSIFEGTLYGGPGSGRAAVISFGIDNTVEAKVLTPTDSTGKGDKKIPIIQGLSVSGSYDFLKPSYKLSTLSLSGRSQFTDKLGINYNGSLNPYQVRDSVDLNNRPVLDPVRGRQLRNVIDKYTWQAGKLPRLTSFGFSFDYSFNPEALKRRNANTDALKDKVEKGAMTEEQAEALARISRDPNAFVDFKIPWNFAFSYSFQYNTTAQGTNATYTNTLNFNGDANITPKWKVQFTSGWDFQAKNFSTTNFSIYRDLHCWDMSVSWVPFGAYQSYSIDIKVKASVLQDLKLSKRKSYLTRF
ncbi:MAG: putative LPS assembly protein LptD [Bacteroidota bacterium]